MRFPERLDRKLRHHLQQRARRLSGRLHARIGRFAAVIFISHAFHGINKLPHTGTADSSSVCR